MTVEPPIIGGRYLPLRLLSESQATRILLARRVDDDTSCVVKIVRAATLFDSPASAFFQGAPELFGAGAPNNLVESEAVALGRLSHPCIPRLVDSGLHQGLPYLVTDVRPGLRLDHVSLSQPTSIAPALSIARDLLAALEHAHGVGVVHRDLSCRNVLVDLRLDGAGVTLIDFELASVDGAGVAGIVGSASYRAPEIIARRWCGEVVVDQRADLYALGVVIFRLMSGRLPYPDRSTCAFEQATGARPVLRDLRPDLPIGLLLLVDGLLDQDPAARISSAAEAREVLSCESAATGSSTTRRSTTRAAPERSAALPVTAEVPRTARDLIASADRWIAAGRPGEALHAAREARLLAFHEAAAHATPNEDARHAALLAEAWIDLHLDRPLQSLLALNDAEALLPGDASASALRGLALLADVQGALPEIAVGSAAACFVHALEATPPPAAPLLAGMAQASLEIGAVGLAVAAALRADDEALGRAGLEQVGAGVLGGIGGQLVLLLAHSTKTAELLLPLATVCTQLGLRAAMSPSGSAAAHDWFRRGREAGRVAITTLAVAPAPEFSLHLAVCERSCGDGPGARRMLDLALAAGLLDAPSFHRRFGEDLVLGAEELTPLLTATLALRVGRQLELLRRLATQRPISFREAVGAAGSTDEEWPPFT